MSVEKFTAKLGGNIRESMGAASTGAGGPLPVAAVTSSRYQGISRPKEALTIPLDRVIADPDQPRKDFDPGPLADLAASLKARGQLQPCRVRWSAQADRWVVIAGERRYRAAMLAGLTSLLCVEAKGGMTADEIFEDQLVENCVREDLKPIEQAHAFKALIDRRGISHRQLAEILNISHMAVNRALTLLELPEDLQGRIAAGALAPSVACEVAKLEDRAEQREVADRVVSEGLSRDEVKAAVRLAASRPARAGGGKGRGEKARPITSRVFKTKPGIRITAERKRGIDHLELVEALREALSKAEGELDAMELEARDQDAA